MHFLFIDEFTEFNVFNLPFSGRPGVRLRKKEKPGGQGHCQQSGLRKTEWQGWKGLNFILLVDVYQAE